MKTRRLATWSQQQKLEDDQKLNVLINFEIISEADTSNTYQTAITLLENSFVKPKDTVFARHLLAICKQEVGESLEQFVQKLKNLAKDCDFKAVTAEHNKTHPWKANIGCGIYHKVKVNLVYEY